MTALVVYDSFFGNTEKIARAMSDALPDSKLMSAGDARPSDVQSIDVLIVGSPTRGFRASEKTNAFIQSIPANGLQGKKVAVFDTRMPEKDVGRGVRFIMKVGGYAAPKMAEAVKKKGGELVTTPEGFFVVDREGPLKEGELERAAKWAETVSGGK